MGKNQSKLTPEVIDSLTNRTRFSKHDLKKWYRGFMKEYPHGYLTLDDFKAIYTKQFPSGDASTFSEHAFKLFDSNKDGIVDFAEYICGLGVSCNGKLSEKLEWAFKMYDLDEDGYLSQEDLLQVVKGIYQTISGARLPADEATPELRTAKILLMDADGDGKLSLEEFTRGAAADPSITRLLQASKAAA